MRCEHAEPRNPTLTKLFSATRLNPPDFKKPMPKEQRTSDEDLDELSAKLNDGLKTCRSMVENYRAMLSGEQIPPANDQDKSSSDETAA
jgi:hypothetical protein